MVRAVVQKRCSPAEVATLARRYARESEALQSCDLMAHKCIEESQKFASLLKPRCKNVFFINGVGFFGKFEPGYAKEWRGKETAGHRLTIKHQALLVDGTVVDLTSQQFGKRRPQVYPRSRFDEEWARVTVSHL